MINPDKLLNWKFEEKIQEYSRRDTMFYALSLGFGTDPLDEWQLEHVLEDRLRAFPTMALVLAHPGPWTALPETGVNRKGVVHGEQILTIHRRLPATARVKSTNRVTAVVDKGPTKGAVIQTEREIYEAETGHLLATLGGTTFCRRDGGFDSTGQNTFGSPREEASDSPKREPDVVAHVGTSTQAALLYRLNGDYNPIHSDPEAARESGFERPIVHGLLTFGLAARLLEQTFAPLALGSIRARFAATMFPGETLMLRIWRDTDNIVWFSGTCKERDVDVLSKGQAIMIRTDPAESRRST